jgi:hypothetical protein
MAAASLAVQSLRTLVIGHEGKDDITMDDSEITAAAIALVAGDPKASQMIRKVNQLDRALINLARRVLLGQRIRRTHSHIPAVHERFGAIIEAARAAR